MSKKNKQDSTFITSYGEHSPKDHQILPLWNGSAQATNARNLREHFKDYDLCLFLTDMQIPAEIPFTLGLVGPVVKSKIILFAIEDREPPDDGPFWEWLLATVKAELVAGGRIGVACIGGHGRTGTVLATLWGLANQKNGVPTQNPILAIRAIIGCDREVESNAQEKFVYEQTGFPEPEEFLEKKWSFASAGVKDFVWWAKDGTGVNPVDLEPSLYPEIVVPAGTSLLGEPYAISGKWAIPLWSSVSIKKVPDNNRMPLDLCKMCYCAMGYLLPLHKGSHKTCTVCPILEERGITRTKPASELPKAAGVADRCDFCGFMLVPAKEIKLYLNGDLYQFCDYGCKGKYWAKVKKDLPAKEETEGFFCDRTFCNSSNAKIVKVIGDHTFHFCTSACLESVMAKAVPKALPPVKKEDEICPKTKMLRRECIGGDCVVWRRVFGMPEPSNGLVAKLIKKWQNADGKKEEMN